ncbi:uncharacterized protein LOC128730104, partial [Anopheles nili]|uniref:uncharacterized protein LOC128730104 n=1 Tax=Anopheles nili TaxID=185578 RepID=UPI00237C003D
LKTTITNRNKKIHVPKQFYLSLNSQLFIIPNGNKYIYDLKELQEDNGECFPALLRGQQAACDFVANPTKFEIIHLDMMHIPINSAVEFTIKTTCGLKKRNLTGSFLLSYKSCEIFLNEEEISNNKTELHGSPLNLPIYGLNVTSVNNVLNPNLEHLYSIHVELRKEMHQIRLESKSFTWNGWSITSLASTPIMLLIVICVYLIIRKQKRTVINIRGQPTSKTTSDQPEQEIQTDTIKPPAMMAVFRTEP